MNILFTLTAQSDTSFFEDVWNYLYDVYLRVDVSYENLNFTDSPLFSLRLTVLGIFIGTIIACVAMAYHKQVLGGIVRKLIAHGALSKNSAKSAVELGYGKNFLVKNALCRSVALKRVVRCVGEEEFILDQAQDKEEYEKKRAEGARLPRFKDREYLVDIESDVFYIPEELRIRAEIKFEKKGSGWLSTVLGIIGLIIIFFLLLLVLPHLLGFVDGML